MVFILFLFTFFTFHCQANNTNTTDNSANVIVDGIYYDWNVYYIDDLSNNKKCYIASFAKSSIGNYKQERKPYVMITLFKGQQKEEISIFANYKYKLNSNIYIGINNRQFKLFSHENMAWAKTPEDDKDIIQSLLTSETLKVRGEVISGEYTVDTYSTKGLERAYNKMKKLCK